MSYMATAQKNQIPSRNTLSVSLSDFTSGCACVQEELKGFTAAVGTGRAWEMWKLKSGVMQSGQVNGDYVASVKLQITHTPPHFFLLL